MALADKGKDREEGLVAISVAQSSVQERGSRGPPSQEAKVFRNDLSSLNKSEEFQCFGKLFTFRDYFQGLIITIYHNAK